MECVRVELYRRIEDERRADQRRDAEVWRLLHKGGHQPEHWLHQKRCWLLCQVGRWMVRLGREMERAGTYRVGPIMP